MSELVQDVMKDWSERLSRTLQRPPSLAVVANSREEARELLNSLLGDCPMGADDGYPGGEIFFAFAHPPQEFPTTDEQWKDAIGSCMIIISLLEKEESYRCYRQWKVPMIHLKVAQGEGHKPDDLLEFEEERSFKMVPYKSQPLEAPLLQVLMNMLPLSEATALAVLCPNRELKEEVSHKYIDSTSLKAALIGAIPIPVSDIFLLLPLQVAGVLKLAAIYNHGMDKDRAKELIGVFGGGMIMRTAARNLAKLVPGVGSAVGAGVAYAGTYAILKTARIYFERGAVLDKEERSYLKQVFQEAQKEGKEEFSQRDLKAFRKLQLKYESGAITREEFEEQLRVLEEQSPPST